MSADYLNRTLELHIDLARKRLARDGFVTRAMKSYYEGAINVCANGIGTKEAFDKQARYTKEIDDMPLLVQVTA